MAWGPTASATTNDVTVRLTAPIVGIAATPTGQGYWEVGANGSVFAFGTAADYGSMGGQHLNAPIVGIAAAPTGHGYWEVASDGGIFAFGSARYYGSMGGQHLNAPIVGIAAAPTGQGYWEVASDGGIFTFGAAHFYGSMGGQHLNAPIVGISAAPTGRGYWEVATDGGIFTFGQSHFYGSMGGEHLNRPVVGMATSATGSGYWEVASDGGIFTFGNAAFAGSMGGKTTGGAVVGMAADHAGAGYWEVATKGEAYSLGSAQFEGDIVEPATAPTPGILAEGSTIASVADSQLGQTNPYLYGPDGSTWCAFFTSWVWRQAGVPIPETGPAADIGTWALANGGTLLPPTATPAPGDAVLWVRANTPVVWPNAAGLAYPNIEHVNVVTQVLGNGDIVTVGGNELGAVRQTGPFAPAGASSYFGQAIYGFVQPPVG